MLLAAALLCAPSANAAAVVLSCSFDRRCEPDQGCGVTALSMIFHMDDVDGSAFIIGNNGVAEVQAISGNRATSFVERLPSGAVQVTVIDLTTTRAVHSRHTVKLGGGILPSQYYGTCTVGS